MSTARFGKISSRAIWILAAALIAGPAHAERISQAVNDALTNIGAAPTELNTIGVAAAGVGVPVAVPTADAQPAPKGPLPVDDAKVRGYWHQVSRSVYYAEFKLSTESWMIVGTSRRLVEIVGWDAPLEGSYEINGSTLRLMFRQSNAQDCKLVSIDRLECSSRDEEQIVYLRGPAQHFRGGAFDTGSPHPAPEPRGGGSL